MDLPSPTRVGAYEIVAPLGVGGMGQVYRARDTRLDREVALKCPCAALAGDTVALRRFAREARASARLSHPHIVQLHEVLEQDGLPWLVMQLVRGGNLKATLAERGALPVEQTLRWAEELASALAHAHGQQILHRDIKPGNVLIDADGRALLTDFGLARLLPPVESIATPPTASRSITREGGIVGTPAYMSPEQALGHPLDERSDLFSLGAVIYEMCTGRPLVSPKAWREAAEALLDLEPPSVRALNPAVPAELERIVRKAVAWRPEGRYPNAGALATDLRRCRQQLEFAPRWRYRIVLGAGVVTFVAAVALGIAWVGSARPLSQRVSGGAVASALITWPSFERDARISPDKRWISFVSDRDGQHRVWLRSSRGELVQPLTPADTLVVSHAWSSSGDEIAYVARQNREAFLQIIPALGGPPQKSVRLDPRFAEGSIVRWVGTHLYFETAEHGLVQLDLASERFVPLIEHTGNSPLRRDFDVRSDERRIVYSATTERGSALWTSDLDGRRAARVTSGDHIDSSPRWIGRDGDSVIYTSNRSGQHDLWRVRLADGATERVTLSPGREVANDTALDGSMMIFLQDDDAAHLWALDRETGESRQLTADALGDFWPTVSAQDNLVVFQRTKPRLEDATSYLGTELWMGRLVGDRLKDARALVAKGEEPHLSPDGRWLAYVDGTELWIRAVSTNHPMRASQRFKQTGVLLFPLAWAENNVAWLTSAEAVVFVEETPDGDRMMRLALDEPERPAETLVVAPPDARIRDPRAAGDGEHLAYVLVRSDGFELRCLSLPNGDDRVLLVEQRSIKPAGWLDDQTLLYLAGSYNNDFTQTQDAVAVDLAGHTRRLATVEHVLRETATLDVEARLLYVTVVGPHEEHNVLAVSLADGRGRPLTRNEFPGVSFSAMQVLPGGSLIHTRQEHRADLWTIEFPSED